MNIIRPMITLLFFLSLLCTQIVFAQEGDANEARSLQELAGSNMLSKGVYKIEMIVLAHKNDNGVPIEEDLSQSLDTRYPSRIKVLKKNPEAVMIRDYGSGSSEQAAIRASDLMTRLSESQRELNEMAMQMRLRKGYRLLFHEAWFQKLDARSKSAAVLIEGGRWYDPYHELSGSVTLSKERYLHIDTDIWLAEFTDKANLNQIPWHARSSKRLYYALPTRDMALGKASYAGRAPNVTQTSILNGRDEITLFEYGMANTVSQGQHIAKEVYALQQKRRLRSDELHYLDHPKLGIIIRLTRLDTAHNS